MPEEKTKKEELKKDIVDTPKNKTEEKSIDVEEVKKESKEKIDEKEETKEEKIEEKAKDSKKSWRRDDSVDITGWVPKTKLGEEVKTGKIRNIDEILDDKRKILESEIVDSLMTIKSELINIGQAKGKFGGGKRRIWRQTQRKTKEGNVPTFSTLAVIGDENGHIGIGSGKAKETLPAREKAIRKAKLQIIKIKRGCGSFDCICEEQHSIPFTVMGKSGSCTMKLMPAPQGTGLVIGDECKKILKLAGIKDIYSVSNGKIRTTFNLAKATLYALNKTNDM